MNNDINSSIIKEDIKLDDIKIKITCHEYYASKTLFFYNMTDNPPELINKVDFKNNQITQLTVTEMSDKNITEVTDLIEKDYILLSEFLNIVKEIGKPKNEDINNLINTTIMYVNDIINNKNYNRDKYNNIINPINNNNNNTETISTNNGTRVSNRIQVGNLTYRPHVDLSMYDEED